MEQLSLCLLPPPFCVQSNISSIRQLSRTDLHQDWWESSCHIAGVPNKPSITGNILHLMGTGAWMKYYCVIQKACPLSYIITVFNELNYKWSETPNNKSKPAQTVGLSANTEVYSFFFLCLHKCISFQKHYVVPPSLLHSYTFKPCSTTTDQLYKVNYSSFTSWSCLAFVFLLFFSNVMPSRCCADI